MLNRLASTPIMRRAACAIALGAVVISVGLVLWPKATPTAAGERTRTELDLLNGRLFVRGENHSFTGTLVEDYRKDARKVAVSVRDGKADGVSRGWFENGRLEVEETFENGVSHGTRLRYHENGTKKSEARIVHGVITGRFITWHDNGQKAAEVMMVDGKADGLAEAWHPSGKLKSRVQLDHGIPGEKQFFPDPGTIAQTGEPLPSSAP